MLVFLGNHVDLVGSLEGSAINGIAAQSSFRAVLFELEILCLEVQEQIKVSIAVHVFWSPPERGGSGEKHGLGINTRESVIGAINFYDFSALNLSWILRLIL